MKRKLKLVYFLYLSIQLFGLNCSEMLYVKWLKVYCIFSVCREYKSVSVLVPNSVTVLFMIECHSVHIWHLICHLRIGWFSASCESRSVSSLGVRVPPTNATSSYYLESVIFARPLVGGTRTPGLLTLRLSQLVQCVLRSNDPFIT